MTSYSFVLDANGKQLAPTKEPKAWFLIRKKRAALVSKYPMVIQLKKKIQENDIITLVEYSLQWRVSLCGLTMLLI